MDKVEEWRYLRMWFKKNNSKERHIRQIPKKTMRIFMSMCRIRKKIFKEDCTRMMLVDCKRHYGRANPSILNGYLDWTETHPRT